MSHFITTIQNSVLNLFNNQEELEDRVAVNEDRIEGLETLPHVDLTTEVAELDATADDHEGRITTLEDAPSGGVTVEDHDLLENRVTVNEDEIQSVDITVAEQGTRIDNLELLPHVDSSLTAQMNADAIAALEALPHQDTAVLVAQVDDHEDRITGNEAGVVSNEDRITSLENTPAPSGGDDTADFVANLLLAVQPSFDAYKGDVETRFAQIVTDIEPVTGDQELFPPELAFLQGISDIMGNLGNGPVDLGAELTALLQNLRNLDTQPTFARALSAQGGWFLRLVSMVTSIGGYVEEMNTLAQSVSSDTGVPVNDILPPEIHLLTAFDEFIDETLNQGVDGLTEGSHVNDVWADKFNTALTQMQTSLQGGGFTDKPAWARVHVLEKHINELEARIVALETA